MKAKHVLSIDTKGLTDGENCGLEMLQIKSEMRKLGITSIWAFFKVDYPTYSKEDFNAKINSRGTDKDFVNKLRSVYERQKK